MDTPIENEPLEPTDDRPVEPATAVPDTSRDAELPEADAVDQARETTPGWRVERLSTDPEVPEADALDQAMAIPIDDEFDR